jgi:hypothetical protein
MQDLEVQLVDTVVKLAAARRLMGQQLRRARILKEKNQDLTACQEELRQSRVAIRELQWQRKELVTRLRNMS